VILGGLPDASQLVGGEYTRSFNAMFHCTVATREMLHPHCNRVFIYIYIYETWGESVRGGNRLTVCDRIGRGRKRGEGE